jgi:outer membrane protein assembly factor BamB
MPSHPFTYGALLIVMAAGVQPPRPSARASESSRTPAPIWRLDGEGRGVPAIAGSTVYFLTKRHEVVAVDVRSGAVVWRVSTGEPGEETYGTAIVPVGSVVVAGDYNLVALDAATGAERWKFTPVDGYGPGIYLGEAAAGQVFAGSPAGRLYSVNATDGSCSWSVVPVPSAKTTVFTPIVSGDVVVAGYTTFASEPAGGIVAVDRLTGRELWKRALGGAGRASGFGGGLVAPAFAQSATARPRRSSRSGVGRESLVIASSGDGGIHAFDKRTGAVRWSLPAVKRDGDTSDAPTRDLRPLAATGRMLYAGSLTGTVVAYDITGRKERWRYAHDAGGSTSVRVVSDEDEVYVSHLGGLMVALDAKTGAERWQIGDFSSGFMWAPLMASERVYVGASTAGLFALPRARRVQTR